MAVTFLDNTDKEELKKYTDEAVKNISGGGGEGGTSTSNYVVHEVDYLSPADSPAKLKFGTHISPVAQNYQGLPEITKDTSIKGILKSSLFSTDSTTARQEWFPVGSSNLYYRIPLTELNWGDWQLYSDGADGDDGLSAYEIWLQQGNTGSEADFLESLKGGTGATGATGANGTSVTITSVTESTADGGENIVTFSNGQTLKVKNGSKGSKGDAYTLTEADKAEIISSVIETLGGNPIFGYVDENNNIVVQGNLADGTYLVKYEMEDGSTIDIGNLELDSNVYYSVTNNLTNCINNNNATQAVQGGSYSATITADIGYELSSIVVTMGGVNISSSAISGGNITIANVTGNIAITAIAEEIVVEPTNLLPQAIFNTSEDPVNSDKGYVSGYKISNSGGGLSQVTGCYASGYIKVGINDTVTIKNITLRSDGNSNNIILYSNTNKGSKIIGKPGPTGAFDDDVTVSNGVYSFTPSTWTTDASVAYFRFSCGGITDETIVTVSKAIG